MTDKIFTGKDRATELGYLSYQEFIAQRGKTFNHIPNWGDVETKEPITAEVDGGRWLAQCECGEYYYVEPDFPFGYCIECGNASIKGGKVRTVIFPANRLLIEEALTERKLAGDPGTIRRLGSQAYLHARLVHPEVMPRHWKGQSVDELKAEHKKVKSIISEMKKNK